MTKEHVELVSDILIDEYSKAGLNMLAQTQKFNKITVEDVQTLITKIETAIPKEPIEQTKIIEILTFILHAGRVTQDQIKTCFELTEKSQLRPLMATLQTLDLVKMNRGYYATTKLIEAYKATENFAVLAVLDTVKKEPPIQKILTVTEKQAIKPLIEKEKVPDIVSIQKNKEGGFNSEAGKDGTNGKNKKQRYCSEECINFDKSSCKNPSGHWGDLNMKSLLPLNCVGFEAPNPGA